MKGTGPNFRKFYSRLFSVDWEGLLKIDEINADKSTRIYFDNNMLLDTYVPLKNNKYLLKFKSKPWITLGLQKINICQKIQRRTLY